MQWVPPIILALLLQLFPVAWLFPGVVSMAALRQAPVTCVECQTCPCTPAEAARCCPNCPLSKTTTDNHRTVAPKRDTLGLNSDRHNGEPSYPSIGRTPPMPRSVHQVTGATLVALIPDHRAFIGVWVI